SSLAFYAGEVRRAPAWMSRCGLEWIHRLGREPRRLWRRYLVDAARVTPVLAALVLGRIAGRPCRPTGLPASSRYADPPGSAHPPPLSIRVPSLARRSTGGL